MLSSLTKRGSVRGMASGGVALLLVSIVTPLWGTGPVPAPDPVGPTAVVNVDVYPVDGPVVRGATVIWERGVITAIGSGIEVPADAQRVDGTGARLYPVFIACGTQLGLVEIDAVRATRDLSEVGELNPNIRAEVSVNPDSALIPVTRSSGVAVVQTMPSGGLVSGSSALLRLDGWTWEDMVIAAPLGIHVQWPSMWIAPGHDAEKVAKARERRDRDLVRLRELFDLARAYAERPTATAKDLRCEALLPVVRGRIPVFLHADSRRDIEAAVTWATELELRAVVVGGRDAPQLAPWLRERGVCVIYGPVHSLPRNRGDAYDDTFTGPLRLHEAGVRFAIASLETSNARNLPYEAATAAAYGLPREVALRSITLSPAEILGVDDRLGSIAKGKVASLQMTDGDPLEITTQVLRVWLDGRPVDLSNRQTELYKKYSERVRRDEATRRGRF